MTNANINSLTLSNSVAQADKIYFARSPFGSTDDYGALFSAINSSFDHDTTKNYAVNQHRVMSTEVDTITAWSGYQINSLLATKQGSTNLTSLVTYATSVNVNTHTALSSIHRGMGTAADTITTWSGFQINSLLATKQGSTNLTSLVTYATSVAVNTHTALSSIHRGMNTTADTIVTWSGFHINSLFATKQGSTNLTSLVTYATSVNVNVHTALSSIHRGMDTSTSTIVVWSGFQINSLLGTKVNSTLLATYATSATLNNHDVNTKIHSLNALGAIVSVVPASDFIAVHNTAINSLKKVKPYEFWGTLETTQISTTTYNVQASDFGKNLEFTGTAAQTVTIGNDADLSYPTDGAFMWTCINTNVVAFTGGTSSTINNVSGFTSCSSIYGAGGWRKRAAQTWVGWGNLDA